MSPDTSPDTCTAPPPSAPRHHRTPSCITPQPVCSGCRKKTLQTGGFYPQAFVSSLFWRLQVGEQVAGGFLRKLWGKDLFGHLLGSQTPALSRLLLGLSLLPIPELCMAPPALALPLDKVPSGHSCPALVSSFVKAFIIVMYSSLLEFICLMSVPSARTEALGVATEGRSITPSPAV